MPADASINPRKLEMAMSAAMQALAALPDDSIDEQLRRDTIEGQSDALDLIDRYAEQALADKRLAEMASERARRLEARADKYRSVITSMMEALELSEPLERPLFTASVVHTRKALVTNADEIPPEYVRTSIDMRLLGKALMAGNEIAGAELSNSTPSLRLTTR